MAHNLIETDTFDANVSVPDDGDTANAASVEVPYLQVTNRTRFLFNRRVLGTTPIELGAPPAVAFLETITTDATLTGWSVATVPLADLAVGDVIHITGSVALLDNMVGPPTGFVVGDSATNQFFVGYMIDTSGGGAIANVAINACHTVQIGEGPTMDIAFGIVAPAAGASLDVSMPANLHVSVYK